MAKKKFASDDDDDDRRIERKKILINFTVYKIQCNDKSIYLLP